MLSTTSKALEVISRLKQEYPSFTTALNYEQDWQLLVAVILSAQTKDETVNKVTEQLFKRFKTPEEIANADIRELEELIKPTGYYKTKARNLQKCMVQLVEKHNSKVPDNMDDLISLPGVGRKTANVVLHILFRKAQGIVMDTHISRVTFRLGFTDKKDPEKAERVMMRVLPKEYWKEWGDLLIQHGRKICHSIKPRCDICVLSDLCEYKKNRVNK